MDNMEKGFSTNLPGFNTNDADGMKKFSCTHTMENGDPTWVKVKDISKVDREKVEACKSIMGGLFSDIISVESAEQHLSPQEYPSMYKHGILIYCTKCETKKEVY